MRLEYFGLFRAIDRESTKSKVPFSTKQTNAAEHVNLCSRKGPLDFFASRFNRGSPQIIKILLVLL
jgi:hypothetical protein